MTSPLSFSKSGNLRLPLAVAFLLAVFLGLNILIVQHKTKTWDEMDHYRYGLGILQRHATRILESDDSKMPVSCLNALPRKMVEWLRLDPDSAMAGLLSRFVAARLVTTLFSLLLAYLVFRWSQKLYGDAAGIFSLILYVFSPNILAHSHYVTTDIYASLAVTLSLYTFWRFMNDPGWKNAAISAIALGVSQLAKYTCVYLYPIFGLIVLIRHGPGLLGLIRVRDLAGIGDRLNSFIKFTLFFAVVSVLLINIGFVFENTFTPLGAYEFQSSLFQSLQKHLRWMENFPIPLPYPYLDGLDWVKFNEGPGGRPWTLYLLGKIGKTGYGFKGYYFWAYFFKETIGLQIILGWSLAAYFLSRLKRQSFLKDELFLWGPILFFTVYFNFFFNAQLGIRFILIIFPLLYVFCGSLVKEWGAMGRKAKACLVVLALTSITSVMSYYPHILNYFNEWVWDRKKAYKVLVDSNMDWHQSRWYLSQYRRRHPEAIFEPAKMVAGKIIVSGNHLVGLFTETDRYKWLRENFEPADHIAYTYLVFEVKPEDLERLKARSD